MSDEVIWSKLNGSKIYWSIPRFKSLLIPACLNEEINEDEEIDSENSKHSDVDNFDEDEINE